MEAQLDRLFQALDRLHQRYDKLLSCIREQQVALNSNDVEKLESLVASIETLVSEVEEAERQRIDATKVLANELGLPSDAIAANVLAERLDDTSARRLLQSVDKLRKLITELAEQNDRNRVLTEQSAQFTKKTLEIIAETVRGETYGRKTQAPRAIRTFDTRV